MRLTTYTDYAMRTLFFLATNPNRKVTVGEIAKFYDISQNHLVKVVQDLVKGQYIISSKGRGGGMVLAMPASEINLGEVIKLTEPEMKLIDCVGCTIVKTCKLPSPLKKAVAAFVEVLNQYSLQDIIKTGPELDSLMNVA